MATTISQVENMCAWVVAGRDEQYLDLFTYERPRQQPLPGALVTSYVGQRYTERTGITGLGIVIATTPHPTPCGDTQFICLVVWNFDTHFEEILCGLKK